MPLLEGGQSIRPLQLATTPTPLDSGEEKEGRDRGYVMTLIEKEDEGIVYTCCILLNFHTTCTFDKIFLIVLHVQWNLHT